MKRVAAEREVSFAAPAREAVDRLLIENGDATSAAAKVRILEITGRFRSDRTDVAENRDAYLEGIYADRD